MPVTPSRSNLNLYVGGYYSVELDLEHDDSPPGLPRPCPLNAGGCRTRTRTRDDGPRRPGGGDASRHGRRWGPSVRSDCHQLDIKFNLTRLEAPRPSLPVRPRSPGLRVAGGPGPAPGRRTGSSSNLNESPSESSHGRHMAAAAGPGRGRNILQQFKVIQRTQLKGHSACGPAVTLGFTGKYCGRRPATRRRVFVTRAVPALSE